MMMMMMMIQHTEKQLH